MAILPTAPISMRFGVSPWGIATIGFVGCGGGQVDIACSTYDEVFVWQDRDGDGFGSEMIVGYVCAPGDRQATNNVDCDDTQPLVHPLMDEVCDNIDNDCDGVVDEGLPVVPWYRDGDGDGFGDAATQTIASCLPPTATGYTHLVGDCDDGSDRIFPGAIEVCNGGLDDDCDGLVDDADPGVDPSTHRLWHPDEDRDGYGDERVVLPRCARPTPAAVLDGSDCDDTRAQVNPSSHEICDGRDNDCDALIDDDDPGVAVISQAPMHVDRDGDGFGDPRQGIMACVEQPGFAVLNGNDCDDSDDEITRPQRWYADTDGDGYGAGPPIAVACRPPLPGAAAIAGDCDPLAPEAHPGALEDCQGTMDLNCDGLPGCADPSCATAPACDEDCVDVVLQGALPITVTDQAPESDSTHVVSPDDDGVDTGGEVDVGNTTGSCAGDGASPEVVYQWTAPASGDYTLDTAGSDFDTVLYVLDGCGGTELVCNDDEGATVQSEVEITAVHDQRFVIVVDGDGGDRGSHVLTITDASGIE